MHNASMNFELLSVAKAQGQILAAIEPLAAERVPVDDALDRVLARDVSAAGDVPPFASAAMDGYAVLAGPAGRTLRVIGESRAGVPTELVVGAHEAIRTSTGAAMPAGANAVIRQEQVETHGDRVTLRAGVAVADDIRHQGEDLASGTLVLPRGARLGISELAGARRQRLERTARLQPSQIVIVGERADDGVAQSRTLAHDLAGENRRGFLELVLLDHGEEPTLG